MEDMSARYPVVELDFFGLHQQKQYISPSPSYSTPSSSSKSQFQKLLEQQRTVKGMQSAISKLNPQLLKNVISSGAYIKQEPSVLFGPIGGGVGGGGGGGGGALLPPEPKHHHYQTKFAASTLPVFINPNNIPMTTTPPSTSPLTIFYNGTVCVFDIPRDKAESLIKLAENGMRMSSNNNRTNNTNVAVEWTTTDMKMCSLTSSLMDQDKLLETLNGDDLPIARKKSLQRFLAKRKERLTMACPYNHEGEVK